MSNLKKIFQNKFRSLINFHHNVINLLTLRFYNIIKYFVNYKLSLKEIYFSLTTWLLSLIIFIGISTNFQISLMLINILVALLIFGLLALITNTFLLSAFCTLLISVTLEYIKKIKWQFLLQDIHAADTIMLKLTFNHGLLRSAYEYATKGIYVIIGLLLINFMLFWIKSDALIKKSSFSKSKFYVLRILSMILAGSIIFYIVKSSNLTNSYFNKIVDYAHCKVKYLPKKIYGPYGNVLFTLKDFNIVAPSVSVDSNLILNESKNAKSKYTNLSNLPDIVVILNESTINPYNLDYDFIETLDFESFKSNQFTKFGGVLDVNTFGGSSWISEYELNTGLPHKYFNGPSYMPFLTMVPLTQKSIISYLRSIGYEVSIIYPIDKKYSMADVAYKSLGAHKIYDIFDFDYTPTSWQNVPDIEVGKIITKILNRNNRPKYIFASTMRNHGPHSSYKSDKLGCGIYMNDELCSKLNDYLDRMASTNADQLILREDLMNRDKPTILVNFGDHMPSFEGYSTQLKFNKNIKDFYKTFYDIETNFELRNEIKPFSELDITFISGLILDIAQINNDEFYQANSYMRRICQGNLKNCSKDHFDLIESYKSLVLQQLKY